MASDEKLPPCAQCGEPAPSICDRCGKPRDKRVAELEADVKWWQEICVSLAKRISRVEILLGEAGEPTEEQIDGIGVSLSDPNADPETMSFIVDLEVEEIAHDVIARLSRAEAEVAEQRLLLREVSRKGSIGSVDNVYCPQLSREHVDGLLARIRAHLPEESHD